MSRLEAKPLAQRIAREMTDGKILVANADTIKAAIAGYMVGSKKVLTVAQSEAFERDVFRAFVEACT